MDALAFRNVNVSPDDPVSTWPQEAVQTALERGSLTHWRRLAESIEAEPWGPSPAASKRCSPIAAPTGSALRSSVRSRRPAKLPRRRSGRRSPRRSADSCESGLSRSEFATRVGTSPSRLSTYATGKVTPSAALLLRMQRVARSRDPRRPLQAWSEPGLSPATRR